ncbi:hypothetical protein CCZ01_04295 [Helicobacter monodelphidis]|uniref:flagellar biosynthesis anti-sigma factor FlgM n=1 Tax=Helicobacter sp. 15-1451 TaxID=2004995 RepID=UPI000DCE5F10|nr:flagellar biosynthesis anti-sigma factor FlgM [Helicobacter sp. 15-1451]RAX58034.1 hypothetical protein CCZ01_04295 [Helicobacter sp. 15-1451]
MISSIQQNAIVLQQVGSQAIQSNGDTLRANAKSEKVELSRSQEIKEALAKGEYKIDIGGSAAKMARNLLGR